jgi:putative ABC transport system ATP-binding protein
MAMLDDNPLISCRGVAKVYGSGNAEVHALRGVDLDVYAGELTMLVGPRGCGKTTLLSVLAGILRPTSGTVDALGTDLTRLSSWQRTAFRRDNVGFVFQQFNLLPALTAAENAAVPLVIKGYSKRKAVAAAEELLGKMGMADRVNNLPGKLSGGQQQRVAIARALVHHPHLLVCDEPTSALDAKTGHTILELLRNVAVEGDRAVIIVTHDSRIFEFADNMARMDDGHIVSLERRTEREAAVVGEATKRQSA